MRIIRHPPPRIYESAGRRYSADKPFSSEDAQEEQQGPDGKRTEYTGAGRRTKGRLGGGFEEFFHSLEESLWQPPGEN